MHMTKHMLWYALTGVMVLLLLGLLWWFYFLRAKEATITAADAARGYGAAAPTPSNPIGSTYSNILSGLSSLIAGGDTSSTAPTNAQTSLWRVTKTPVAGFAFETGSSKLLFAERSTGYILEANPASETLTRITSKLVPKTYEAVFGKDGDVILRSLDEIGLIKSFAGTIAGFPHADAATSSSAELRGADLARNITTLVPMPQTREIVYAVKGPGGESSIVRSKWDGTKRIVLLSSPLSGWQLSAPGDGRIFLAQNAADDISGFAYELKDGALVPTAREVLGLTILPRAGSSDFLIGESRGGALALSARLADGRTIVLPVRTTAGKCVWAPPPAPAVNNVKKQKQAEPLIAYCAVPQAISSKTFLDDWYRGALHTSDTWWRIDANAGTVEQLDLSGSLNGQFDVENPIIDGAGQRIAFMNAHDQSLWLLRMPTTATTTPGI